MRGVLLLFDISQCRKKAGSSGSCFTAFESRSAGLGFSRSHSAFDQRIPGESKVTRISFIRAHGGKGIRFGKERLICAFCRNLASIWGRRSMRWSVT